MTDQEYKKIIYGIEIPANISPDEQRKRYQPLIDFLQTETPEKLYRFRRCTERTFAEFDQNHLSFSPAYKMNDDFDGLLYFDKKRIRTSLEEAMTAKNVDSIFNLLRSGIEIPYEIQKVITPDGFHQFLDKLSQFTPDVMSDLLNQFLTYATQDYDRKMTFLGTMTQSQKIVSLSENITSAAMWGYYADDGKGFALSYNLRDINFVDYCLLPVIYGDERFNATQYATWLFQQNIIQQILISMDAFALYPSFQTLVPCPDFFMTAKALIHKATYWRHEKEWRLIFYEKSALHLEPPCLTKQPCAIYLGRNISKIHEKILRHIAVEKGIPAYRMTVRDDNPLYELYPQQL